MKKEESEKILYNEDVIVNEMNQKGQVEIIQKISNDPVRIILILVSLYFAYYSYPINPIVSLFFVIFVLWIISG